MYTLGQRLVLCYNIYIKYMLENIDENINKVIEWFGAEMRSIQTGIANPVVLDFVKLEAYGSWVNLNHVASIGIEDAKTLRVVPFDKSLIGMIEGAINQADLGLSVISDSDGVRVMFPALTTERRSQYVKMAKERLEEAKVRVRQEREGVKRDIESAFKNGEFGEDDKRNQLEKMQIKIDRVSSELESNFYKKEKEIMGN